MLTNNKNVLNWVDEMVSLCKPDKIVWIDGSEEQLNALRKEAAKYIYQCAEGRPHILPEISVLIRMSKITREDGLKRLESAWIDKKPKEKLTKLCNTANVSQAAVLTKAKIYNKIIRK